MMIVAAAVLGITLVVTRVATPVSSVLGTRSQVCNGTVDFCITYRDGNIRNVSVDAVSGAATDKETTAPNNGAFQRFQFQIQESFAGENGIEIIDEGNRVLLIPGGRSNSYVVHLFNFTTREWRTIDVYCRPFGLAYRPEREQIVGFCEVNTTYHDGTIKCVPYFRLSKVNGQWVDASQSGSCSQTLSTVNITNLVILQGNPDDEAEAVRLYFAELGTNRLHEVRLSAGESYSHEVDSTLKINHLVPVSNISLVGSVSFFGLRLECDVENSASLRQKLFSWQIDSTRQPETGFVEGNVETESTAFDSYNLNYLVTFNAIHNRVIIKENGGSKFSQPLLHPLNNPVLCLNLVEPVTHYLICLAGDGYLPLLINVTDNNAVTNQTLPVDEPKKIIKMGILAEEDMFYLLNDQDELSIFLIATTVICLGTYPVRVGNNFIITAPSNNVNCALMENVTSDEPNSDTHSNLVVAIAVPIAVIVVIVIAGIIVAVPIVRKNGMTGCNGEPNSASSILTSDPTQPTSDDIYSGQRIVEEPPTNSEVVDNGQIAAVITLNIPSDPVRTRNESRNIGEICDERESENCVSPQECTEIEVDNSLEREDPIGQDA